MGSWEQLVCACMILVAEWLCRSDRTGLLNGMIYPPYLVIHVLDVKV